MRSLPISNEKSRPRPVATSIWIYQQLMKFSSQRNKVYIKEMVWCFEHESHDVYEKQGVWGALKHFLRNVFDLAFVPMSKRWSLIRGVARKYTLKIINSALQLYLAWNKQFATDRPSLVKNIIKFYSLMVRLLPTDFGKKYGAIMVHDFKRMLEETEPKSIWVFIDISSWQLLDMVKVIVIQTFDPEPYQSFSDLVLSTRTELCDELGKATTLLEMKKLADILDILVGIRRDNYTQIWLALTLIQNWSKNYVFLRRLPNLSQLLDMMQEIMESEGDSYRPAYVSK